MVPRNNFRNAESLDPLAGTYHMSLTKLTSLLQYNLFKTILMTWTLNEVGAHHKTNQHRERERERDRQRQRKRERGEDRDNAPNPNKLQVQIEP